MSIEIPKLTWLTLYKINQHILKIKRPEASVVDPSAAQQNVGLLFPGSLFFGYASIWQLAHRLLLFMLNLGQNHPVV